MKVTESASNLERSSQADAAVAAFKAGARWVTIVGAPGAGRRWLARRIAAASLRVPGRGSSRAVRVGRVVQVAWGELRERSAPLEDECVRLAPELDARGAAPEAIVLVVEGVPAGSHGAKAVSALLARWSHVHILVTADHPLGDREDAVVRLEPLHDSAAVVLWETTRRTLYPKYVVEEHTLPNVIELIHELDALPGAIREAAQHPLGCEELTKRLRAGDECDGILNESTWPAFDRVIDDLSASERQVALQAALFASSFNAADLEAVMAERESQHQAMAALAQLLRRSLIVSEPPEGPHRLLNNLKRRVLATATTAERRRAERAHASWVAKRAAELTERADTADVVGTLAALDGLRDDLVAVATRAVSDLALAQAAATCLIALDVLQWTRGPVGDELDLWDALIESQSGERSIDAVSLAKLHSSRGLARTAVGRADAGLADMERAVEIASGTRDRKARAWALIHRAYAAIRVGSVALLTESVENAKPIGEALDDARISGAIADCQAALAQRGGELESAVAHAERALSLHRGVGCTRLEGVAVARLAHLALDSGNGRKALRHARAARDMHAELGSRYVEGVQRVVMGLALGAVGNGAQAIEALQAAETFCRGLGERRVTEYAKSYRGALRLVDGDIEGAIAELEPACSALQKIGAHSLALPPLAFCAFAHARSGQPERAAERLEEANGLLTQHDTPANRAVLALVNAALGEEPLEDFKAGADGQPLEVRIATLLHESVFPTPGGANINLTVHTLGYWFQHDGSARVDCRRRGALRNILVRLATDRIHQPGTGVLADELVRVGWPGLKLSEPVARNRLHVTLHRLRELGLDNILEATDEGTYAIKPDVHVSLSSAH
jgi:tetratricopeptide (TPR) repeat protein